MVFNRRGKKTIRGRWATLNVVLHDWWLYQLVSAAGGAIRYDPQPVIKYREHSNNLIGPNLGWRARFIRICMALTGAFAIGMRPTLPHSNACQMICLNRKIARSNVFAKARRPRVQTPYVPKRSGVYRQTSLDNILLVVATIIKQNLTWA